MLNLPNILTLLRIFMIPVLVIFYYWPMAQRELIITTIFVLAAITDWLDGYLARRMNLQTKLGAFLDPVADKLIVSSALVLLVSDQNLLAQVYAPMVYAIATAIIVGREIVIAALREWMAELGERGVIAVGYIGKVKTTVQMIAISLLLYHDPILGLPIFKLGELALYLAALATLWSMVEYLRAAWPYLTERQQ